MYDLSLTVEWVCSKEDAALWDYISDLSEDAGEEAETVSFCGLAELLCRQLDDETKCELAALGRKRMWSIIKSIPNRYFRRERLRDLCIGLRVMDADLWKLILATARNDLSRQPSPAPVDHP